MKPLDSSDNGFLTADPARLAAPSCQCCSCRRRALLSQWPETLRLQGKHVRMMPSRTAVSGKCPLKGWTPNARPG